MVRISKTKRREGKISITDEIPNTKRRCSWCPYAKRKSERDMRKKSMYADV